MSLPSLFNQCVNWIQKKIKQCLNFFKQPAFLISSLIPIGLIAILFVMVPLFFLRQNLQIEQQPASVANELIPFIIKQKDAPNLDKLSSKIFELKFEELFLQSWLQMAKGDSITLLINLVDSLLSLNIRGVNIRECQIHGFKISQAFKHLKADPLTLDWLSNPFMLQKEWATVPKSPIKIKKAPRDTLEASRIKSEPISVENPDVYCTLLFDRNLVIELNQLESPSLIGRLRILNYNLKLSLDVIKSTVESYLHLRPPKNPLWIELGLSRDDIKAIYRALPRQASVALRLF